MNKTTVILAASLLLLGAAVAPTANATSSTPTSDDDPARCMGPVCDAINAVCWLVWKVGKGKVIQDPTCVR